MPEILKFTVGDIVWLCGFFYILTHPMEVGTFVFSVFVILLSALI